MKAMWKADLRNAVASCTCLQEKRAGRKGVLFNRKKNISNASTTLLLVAVCPLGRTALARTGELIGTSGLSSQWVILTSKHTCSLCPNHWEKDFNNQVPNPAKVE